MFIKGMVRLMKKKTIKKKTIFKEQILKFLTSFYINRGYFVSGSISINEIEIEFKCSRKDLEDILKELTKEKKIYSINVLEGENFYLCGEIRKKLIESYNLVKVWKDKTKGQCTFLFEYELEYISAIKNSRSVI